MAGSIDSLSAIGAMVSRETYARLVEFEEVFLRWNQRINLSAPSTLSDVWNRHILDSAQLVSLDENALHWVDLGSGGGFPGLVLAFLLMERPGAHIELIESNRKKAAFLQAIVGQFGLPCRIHAQRIEQCYTVIRDAEVVTARALAPLPALLWLAAPWLTDGAKGLFHKGRDYRRELEESAQLWRFELIEHESRIDEESIILEIRNLNAL